MTAQRTVITFVVPERTFSRSQELTMTMGKREDLKHLDALAAELLPIGRATEHSIQDPFTGEITVKVRL